MYKRAGVTAQGLLDDESVYFQLISFIVISYPMYIRKVDVIVIAE
jgi:hypothetical protein